MLAGGRGPDEYWGGGQPSSHHPLPFLPLLHPPPPLPSPHPPSSILHPALRSAQLLNSHNSTVYPPSPVVLRIVDHRRAHWWCPPVLLQPLPKTGDVWVENILSPAKQSHLDTVVMRPSALSGIPVRKVFSKNLLRSYVREYSGVMTNQNSEMLDFLPFVKFFASLRFEKHLRKNTLLWRRTETACLYSQELIGHRVFWESGQKKETV